jgi:hypothetical protein
MPTPVGLCGVDVRSRRDIVSLEQCNQCHAAETGTGFNHIKNRNAGENAVLSSFLRGNGTLKPSLGELYFADIKVIPPVTVAYQTYGGECKTLMDAPPVTRQFHDLARRALFLAALLADTTPGDNAMSAAGELVTRFTTSAAH